MTVPKSLLLSFFHSAKDALDKCTISEPMSSLEEIRNLLLSTQRQCLKEIIITWSNSNTSSIISMEQVEQELKFISSGQSSSSNEYSNCKEIHDAMEEMNEAARLAYARVALRSECLQERTRNLRDQIMSLKASGVIDRDDLLEYCGLCNAAVRLPIVQKFLSGTNSLTHNDPVQVLFPDLSSTQQQESQEQQPKLADTPISTPVKRLEWIQRKLLQAIGYDADYASEEIKRLFIMTTTATTSTVPPKHSHSNHDFDYHNDTELLQVFSKMASNMNVALTNATIHANQYMYSDREHGGVTRVVSVIYSEKVIDASSGAVIEGSGDDDDDNDNNEGMAPEGQAMEQRHQDRQKADLDMARRAMALQQEILQELLSLDETERNERLALAKATSDRVIQQAMQQPAGPQRVAFLQSIDVNTQRLMAMYKLWENTKTTTTTTAQH